MSNLLGWEGRGSWQFSNGSAHLLDHAAAPRPIVTPDVSSSPQARQRFGDGTNDVFYLKVTVNAGDDVAAGDRLASSQPEVFLLNPGETLTLTSATAITRLDVMAVGDGNSAPPTTGEPWIEGTDDAADAIAAMQTFDFDVGDDVRTVTLESTERFSASTAGAPAATANYVDVFVRGASHA